MKMFSFVCIAHIGGRGPARAWFRRWLEAGQEHSLSVLAKSHLDDIGEFSQSAGTSIQNRVHISCPVPIVSPCCPCPVLGNPRRLPTTRTSCGDVGARQCIKCLVPEAETGRHSIGSPALDAAPRNPEN